MPTLPSPRRIRQSDSLANLAKRFQDEVMSSALTRLSGRLCRLAVERTDRFTVAVFGDDEVHIDRLRGVISAAPDTGNSTLTDGVAVTRPMHEGM